MCRMLRLNAVLPYSPPAEGCTITATCYNRVHSDHDPSQRKGQFAPPMVTKRQLGLVVVILSVLSIAAIVAADVFGIGHWSGFGPLQRLMALLGIAGVIVGGVLISLGDRPA